MWLGWSGLAVSMIGGLVHMLGWDHYYKSYRDYDWRHADNNGNELGKHARKKINHWRKWAMYAQFIGFGVGVLGIGIFAAVNIDNGQRSDNNIELCRPK